MRKGWEYKKLGEVCDITMGQSPDGNSINEVNGVEFHQGKTCFGERFLGVSPLYSNAPTKLAEAHSVLLCVRAPVGYPNITDRKICIGRGLCALYAKGEIDNTFLYYSLLGKQSYFEKKATGSTFKAISSKIVSNTTLSIPPQSTQLAIVSELDKINELIRLKKEQLKDFDNLAQSLFYEMFGDPVENEKGWEVKKLDDVCIITSSKRIFADEYTETGIPFYRSKEVIERSKGLPISVELFISEERYNEIKEKFGVPKIGDILITAVGTIGKIWAIDTDNKFYFKDGNLVWLKDIDNQLANSCFFRRLLEYLIEEYKKTNANGAAYNALTIAKLKLMSCPLPPLSLQQLFAQRIEQIEREKSEVQKSIQDLETLLASRMQYWFE